MSIAIPNSLHTVLSAKKNSFTIKSISDPLSINNNNNSHNNNTSFQTSYDESICYSPESTISDFSNDSIFTANNNSFYMSKSCLSSVTSLNIDDESHPLAFNDITNNNIESNIVHEKPIKVQSSNSFTNLSKSFFKKLTSSTNLLTINPPSRYYNKFNLSNNTTFVPLDTFKTSLTPLTDTFGIDDSMPVSNKDSHINSYQFKNCRNTRASDLFLKLYAIENNCLQKQLLPNIFNENTSFSLFEDEEFEELGNKAKLKLYQSIKLPPRSDLPINNSLKNSNYIKITNQNKNSLIKKSIEFKPWINYEDCLIQLNSKKSINPYGMLNKNTQFVVKGYVNNRWISS